MTDLRGTNRNIISTDDSCCRVSLPKYRLYSELYSSRRISKYIIPSRGPGSPAGLLAEVRSSPSTFFVTSAEEVLYSRVQQGRVVQAGIPGQAG